MLSSVRIIWSFHGTCRAFIERHHVESVHQPFSPFHAHSCLLCPLPLSSFHRFAARLQQSLARELDTCLVQESSTATRRHQRRSDVYSRPCSRRQVLTHASQEALEMALHPSSPRLTRSTAITHALALTTPLPHTRTYTTHTANRHRRRNPIVSRGTSTS